MNLITLTLATARLTRLVVEDDISQPIRDRAMASRSIVGDVVQCRRCTSVWAAAAILIVSRISPQLARMLAISEMAITTMALVDALEGNNNHGF